jgi:hypothetical protein
MIRRSVPPHLALAFLVALALGAASCEAERLPVAPVAGPELGPGEYCYVPEPSSVRVRVEPRFLVLAPGQRRALRVVVDPDFCAPTPVRFASSNPEVAAAPEENAIDYGSPTVDVEIAGGGLGTTTLTVSVPTGEGDATASLEVEVLEPTPPSCAAADNTASTTVAVGGSIAGGGTLAGASVALPERADEAVASSVVWTQGAFDAAIGCEENLTPPGYLALGPAVRFDPSDRRFPRDLPLSIPMNPARLPSKARWRHLEVVYRGAGVPTPQIITVTDPQVLKVDGVWRLSFRTSRLGSYQAVVREGIETQTRARRLTHRAIIGVSMGGSGAAQFGLRHHHLFDVVAALGGPVHWTWLMHNIETHQVGGFRPIAPGTVLADIQLEKTTCSDDRQCAADERCIGITSSAPGRCTFLPPMDEPYGHAATFNNWWFEPHEVGNGATFDRHSYVQMFRDVALVFGNPLSYNPLAPWLPAGADPDHPAQMGSHPEGECRIYAKPYDGPDEDAIDALWSTCPAERCAQHQVLTNYYDDEYNPDGTFPVITFCDGIDTLADLAPYASSWSPRAGGQPMEVALAVDYNANGVRDELEPVIRSGHEPWEDVGDDGVPSNLEPGYGADNLDPEGDDYDPQFNPAGSEGDFRYQEGEPFSDFGLDGVDGTAESPYDHGEGDGVFTAAPGLERFWNLDPHSIVRGWSTAVSQPLDDEALSRVDFWTDGGIRDLLNFAITGRHLTGSFAARGRRASTFAEFNRMPGLDPLATDQFNPAHIIWDDLPGVMMQRYGSEEPTALDLEHGSGMHVGTLAEITKRLQSALYFIGSRWPDAPKALVGVTADKPVDGISQCEFEGNCKFDFTSSFGRTGPVGINLPPGYFHADQQEIRYPVIYMLHGYGMTPEDLQVAIVFLKNWMNGATDSQYSRLKKAILVYVDGRCRWQDGKTPGTRAECIRGNFYTDSIRADGPQIDSWFLELIDHIDRTYRTLGETQVEWRE